MTELARRLVLLYTCVQFGDYRRFGRSGDQTCCEILGCGLAELHAAQDEIDREQQTKVPRQIVEDELGDWPKPWRRCGGSRGSKGRNTNSH